MGIIEILGAIMAAANTMPQLMATAHALADIFRRNGELSEAEWSDLKRKHQAEEQSDHWRP